MPPERIAVNEPNEPESEQPDQIQIHFIKSNQFRVVHVDGAWGGVSPNGKIHMAVFSERSAIPQVVTYQVQDTGLGEELGRVTRGGIVREMEADLVFDLHTAEALHHWLGEKIDALRELLPRVEARRRDADP